MSLSMRRAAFALAVSSAVPLLAGCPEKKAAPVDAAPPPPEPVVDAAPQLLVPMGEEDAGFDAGVDAGPKAMGPAVNTNVARLKQCCAQLATQGKAMANSPEGAMLTAAAAQCSTLATQAGPTGTAPELGTLKTILAGRNMPAICAGF